MAINGESFKGSFVEILPKIELHAHLNGSLTGETLIKLGCSKQSIDEYEKLTNFFSPSEPLQECFKLFKEAHNVTNTPESVYIATKSVIEDFVKDNVIYLELRTTPRAEKNMSKEIYIESVVKGIQESEFKTKINVKLILSIDRRHSKVESNESLKIILKMKEKYPDIIKGIDLSGNPEQGSFDETLFEEARRNGLKTTIHCAEVKNDQEVGRILRFGPDRIGHGTFLHPLYGGSQENYDLYKEKNIPLECCLTSNVRCGTVNTHRDHHIRKWIFKHPFSICTDDKGVFGTTLSGEYEIVQHYFKLTPEELWKINYDSVRDSFASDYEKSKIWLFLRKWHLDHCAILQWEEENNGDVNTERRRLDLASLNI